MRKKENEPYYIIAERRANWSIVIISAMVIAAGMLCGEINRKMSSGEQQCGCYREAR
jgi:hypothetical protein